MTAGNPRQVVGDLPDVVDPVDKRLLRIPERGRAAAEEALDGNRRQTGRRGVGVGEVDAEVARTEAARHRRVGADPVDREPGLVDDVRADHVVVRHHGVLQRGQGALVDGGDHPRRETRGVTAHVAAQQRLLRRHLVVEPHAELVAHIVHRRRDDVAVAGRVGQRDELVQQLRGRGADAAGRDDVAREGQPGQRVANGAGLRREVAAPLRLGEHQDVLGDAAVVAVALVVTESEQPVAEQRTTEGGAELVLLQHGLGLILRREVVARLQRIVAVELPRRPRQRVAARLGDDIHHRAGVAAVFGREGMGQDLEFLDRVGGRAQHEAGVERVVVGGAVHEEIVGLVAHAVDVEAAGGVAEAARRGIARLPAQTARRRHHARDECP